MAPMVNGKSCIVLRIRGILPPRTDRVQGSSGGKVPPRRHPWTVSGPVSTGQLHQPLDAVPMWAVRLQELGHALVVDLAASQCPADVLRDVVVAETDRVRVAVGTETYLRAGPHADSGKRAESPIHVVRG